MRVNKQVTINLQVKYSEVYFALLIIKTPSEVCFTRDTQF